MINIKKSFLNYITTGKNDSEVFEQAHYFLFISYYYKDHDEL